MLSYELQAMVKDVIHKHDIVCRRLAAAHEVAQTSSPMQCQELGSVEALTSVGESSLSSTTPLFYQVAVEGVSDNGICPPSHVISSTSASEQLNATLSATEDMALHNELLDKHQKALCKPCYFRQWGACKRGAECLYCHFPHSKDDFKKVKLSKAGRRMFQAFRAKNIRDRHTSE